MQPNRSVTAVITGGASGLGEATARELAAAGVRVAIFDRDKGKGDIGKVDRGEGDRGEGAAAMAHADILFDRYTAGYNLAESFYMASQFIHWKDMVIGDPICAPYATEQESKL